jgi:hypothetical protein
MRHTQLFRLSNKRFTESNIHGYMDGMYMYHLAEVQIFATMHNVFIPREDPG